MKSVSGSAFGCALLLICPGASAQPPQSPQPIAEAIHQLGDSDFKVRERATDFLISAGESARRAIEAATKSRDAEVAQRARSILRRISLGVAPGTSNTIVALMEKFAASPKDRSGIIQRLQDPAEFSAIRRLLPTIEDHAERIELQSQFRNRVRFIALTLYREKKVDAAAAILASDATDVEGESALRHLLLESGGLEAQIAELQKALAAKPEQNDYLRLALLYRASGDLVSAREQAALARSMPLQIWLAAESDDWEGALRLHRSAIANKPATLQSHALTALFSRYARNEPTLEASSKAILSLFDQNKSNPRPMAEALLAAECYDDAISLYERTVPAKAFYLLWQRQDYDRAFALAKILPGTTIDLKWYESLPNLSLTPNAHGVRRHNYARDIAIALNEVGRREESIRVCELLHDVTEVAPFST